MNIGKILILPLLIFTFCFSSNAQDKKEVMGKYSIKTKDGYLFGNNTDQKSFTVEIKGKSVKPVNSPNPTFNVDGKIVQILIVGVDKFVTDEKKLNEDDILERHNIWEVNYLSEEYGEKIKAESEKISLNNRKALFWGFFRPKFKDSFDRDFFLTTLVGNDLVGLSVAAEPSDEKSQIKKLLTDILSSIKVRDKPFDVRKLSEEIKKNDN